MREEFELVFEIEVQFVLKHTAKKQFFQKLIGICSSIKITDASIIDSYYMLHKAASKARIFVIILKVKASIKDITRICNTIIKMIYGDCMVRSEILIKRKGSHFAKYIKTLDQKGHFRSVTDKDISPYLGGHVVLSEAIHNAAGSGK